MLFFHVYKEKIIIFILSILLIIGIFLFIYLGFEKGLFKGSESAVNYNSISKTLILDEEKII